MLMMRRLLPELDLFETRAQRDAAFRRATAGTFASLRFWGFFVAVVVSFTAVERHWVEPFLVARNVDYIWDVVCVMGIGIFMFDAVVWVSRKRIRRSLREQLAELGLPVCMKCGYDLRAQEAPRCPECGTPFELRCKVDRA